MRTVVTSDSKSSKTDTAAEEARGHDANRGKRTPCKQRPKDPVHADRRSKSTGQPRHSSSRDQRTLNEQEGGHRAQGKQGGGQRAQCRQ